MTILDESVINIAIAVSGAIFAYGLLRGKVSAMDTVIKTHLKEDKDFHDTLDRKLNTNFRRVDELNNRIIIQEQKSGNHLSVKEADEKFVSKIELSLHLKNIDNELAHLNKNGDLMVGKLEELADAFTNYVMGQNNDSK